MFWRARHLRPSPWLDHIPLAFWLVETLRPETIVQLGLGSGSSYFSFCQTVDRLHPGARCHGFHDPSEDEAALALLIRHNAEQYREFSNIARLDVLEAMDGFGDGAIDLLHVDMDLTGPHLDALRADWPRKLSPGAAVLLHGLKTRFADPKAAGLLDELRARHPMVAFEAGDGLAAFVAGGGDGGALGRLATLGPSDPEYHLAHEAFVRLGQGHQFECASRAGKDAAAALAKTRTQMETLRADAATHQAALSARGAQAAKAQAIAHDQRAIIHKNTAQIEALEAENSAQARNIETRFVELAKLTHLLEGARTDRAAAKSDALLSDEWKPLRTPAELIAYADALERRHMRALESRTWRIMEPARRTMRRVKGSKEPEPFAPRLKSELSAEVLRNYVKALEKRHMRLLESRTWRIMEPARRTMRRVKGSEEPKPFTPRLIERNPPGPHGIR
jgi:hypothetical protein